MKGGSPSTGPSSSVRSRVSGVRGTVPGMTLALGNTAPMTQLGIGVAKLARQDEALRVQGAGVMHLAVDNRLAGLQPEVPPPQSGFERLNTCEINVLDALTCPRM